MGEDAYIAKERIYEQLPDGRTVLAAAEGDVLSPERVRELGLVGKGGEAQTQPTPDPYLTEGLKPREGAEADARATGDTAESIARGGREATQEEVAVAERVDEARRRTRTKVREPGK